MSSDIAKSLTRVLGNSYVLYVKTHSYHWNVTGPNFHALHNLFEEQYRQIWASLDDIAERIRALDEYAPVSARVMAEALESVDIKQPAVPLVANVLASEVTDPAKIQSLLVEQVTGSVRWRESVAWMSANGVTEVWEIGAGKALSGMIRRIDRAIACTAVGSPDDVKKAVESLQAG